MKKTVIATLVFVPTLLLSSCYVTSYPGGSNYSSYTPVYYSGYYSGWGGGWGGGWGRGWRNSSWGGMATMGEAGDMGDGDMAALGMVIGDKIQI